jgi:putative tryptophan/tyrosine transport system substrate-binding protein
MIKTKQIYCTILLILCCMLFASCAKKPQKVYRVGILSGLDLFASTVDSFKEKMTDMGYVEGEDVIYDVKKTNFEPDKEKQILKKFVADEVDLIFGFNTEVALEAKAVTRGTDIAVIFANANIEGIDLVNSMSQPGGNVTGVRYPGTDVAVRRLEILHEMIPQAKRIWLPYQKNYPGVQGQLVGVRQVAASLGVTLIEFPADGPTGLQAEMERRSKSSDIGFDAVLFLPESLSTIRASFDAIAKFTRERKIPIGGSFIVTEDYGTIFAVTISNDEVGKQAAYLADKIFKGIPVGTIPVITPEAYLRINYKVVKELGLTVPESLLSRADEIIH